MQCFRDNTFLEDNNYYCLRYQSIFYLLILLFLFLPPLYNRPHTYNSHVDTGRLILQMFRNQLR